ncbi:MAG: patatin-like phospholipase family protein [Pseudomonadota bacterium]
MIETVAQVLRRRRLTGQTSAEDGCRVALVAEGGAMRGVFAGGMVSALEAEGYTSCFDLMVGASAGACALAYLRAGQARFGTRMFYEDLNTGVFFRPRRMLAGGPVLSIDYLVDRVFAVIKQLDIGALNAPGATLYVTGTDIDRVETVDFNLSDYPGRTLDILRATARMPLVSEAPVHLDRRRLLDGALLSPLPTDRAISYGATHVLALLTRQPYSRQIDRASFAERQFAHRFIALRYGRKLAQEITRQRQNYGAVYRELVALEQITVSGAVVAAVAPSGAAPRVHRTSQNTRLLRAGADHGYRRMQEYLGTA